ncbi:MAG: hypothetical protein ACRD2D_13495 [Terriglobales bacterium]
MTPLLTLAFFIGSWTCQGTFANGRAVAGTIRFDSQLDGKALVMHQDDKPPGQFHAAAYWTADRTTNKWTALMQDSSGGARFFVGDAEAQTLTLLDSPILGHKPFAERFRYEKVSADSFRVTWQVQAPSGEWRTGDTQVCRKQ